MPEVEEKVTIKERWNKLDSRRNTVLKRARKCAKLTIPSLLPPDGADENTSLETPYQGLGARGVNNLASKLLITLLPPNRPFFRLMVDENTLNKIEEAAQGARAKTEKKLAELERIIMRHIESEALRVEVFQALKLLIVTGNAAIYQPDDGGIQVYKLDQYVVKRDPEGNLLEVIIREEIAPKALDEDIRAKVISEINDEDKDEPVELFTRLVLIEEGSKWRIHQECAGVPIPESEGTYPVDEAPIMVLRWTALTGEDYGRGLVEEYLGDLITLEALTKALTEGTTIAARLIGLVNPNGVTRPKKLAEARNGDFIEGRAEDVSWLQLDKYMDFKICYEMIGKIEKRLEYAFLLLTSVQRDAERVTAEEVRRMAKDLEDSLGGVYSVLSQELQLPLVTRVMTQMKSQGKLPKLPEGVVKPTIVTGIEALGRGNDLQKLNVFIQGLAPLGEQVIATHLNVSDYIERLATALGIDSDGLVNSKEEVLQMMKAQSLQSLISQTVPGVAKETAKGAMQNARNQNSGE